LVENAASWDNSRSGFQLKIQIKTPPDFLELSDGAPESFSPFGKGQVETSYSAKAITSFQCQD
jgi:hypothetical protein